jgi:hypothetical protein
MKIEHWHRRHALSLASMLPDGRDDAMAVLDCVRELVTAFLQVDAPEPAKAKIVTLVRDCQGTIRLEEARARRFTHAPAGFY